MEKASWFSSIENTPVLMKQYAAECDVFTLEFNRVMAPKIARLRRELAAKERRKNPVWCIEFGDASSPGRGELRIRSLYTLNGVQYTIKKLHWYSAKQGFSEGSGVYFVKEDREVMIQRLREMMRASFRPSPIRFKYRSMTGSKELGANSAWHNFDFFEVKA